jgi:hypothetical protein
MHFQVGDELLPTETLNGSFVGRIFLASRYAFPSDRQTEHCFTILPQNLQQIEELRQQLLA